MQLIKSYKLSKFIILLIFIIMVLNPAVTLIGARHGLLLWFNVIIPSLLPSMIISNIIVSVYGETFKSPFSYIVFTGLLCGYPLGAATTVQLSNKNKMDTQKMQFLMAICNNSSPMFITNYIIISTLNQQENLFQIIAIIYVPLLLLIMLFMICNHTSPRRMIKANSHKTNIIELNPKKADIIKSNFKKTDIRNLNIHAIDSSIMTGFEIITKVGGYIILFSILSAYIQSLPIKNELLKCIITGTLEITTGIDSIGKAGFSMELKKLLVCTVTAFGGMSCIAQTHSIINKSGFSIKKYIYHKIIITLLTAFMAYLMIYVL